MPILIERFQISTTPDLVAPELAPRYNISPTQNVAVVRLANSERRELAMLRWGLIPSWAKDVAMGARLINARAETVAEKPSFRSAFKRRRCLILADGYIEWKGTGARKQPYLIELENGAPFAMAGLWEKWHGPAGGEARIDLLETCTIITTDSNPFTASIHDRMPALLNCDQESLWLECDDPNPTALLSLLRPFEAIPMKGRAISTRINSPRFDDAACIEPIMEF